MQTYHVLFLNLKPINVIPSWSGVDEETAAVITGSQPADQHQRTEGRLHAAAPELLSQPPGDGGGSGEQRSALHAGLERQQPH